MPKSKGRKKPHVKHPDYQDHNFSSLENHPKSGKTLKSPISRLGNVHFSSWKDEFLPNILWAAVVAVTVSREEYLEIFRKIVDNFAKLPNDERHFVTHNWLSKLSEAEFNSVMEPLKGTPGVLDGLAELRLIESLPDRDLWAKFLPELGPKNKGISLITAVSSAIDHQSQLATDIRWLKVMVAIKRGMIILGPDPRFAEKLKEFEQFPNYGDMRKVRPSIRAMEMSCRQIESAEERPKAIPKSDPESFWIECRAKTECFTDRTYEKFSGNTKSLLDELTGISIEIADHIDSVAPNTNIDAKKDSSFGLVLFSIALLMEAASSKSHMLAGGRIMLRSIVEARITLSYLAKKNDPTIWLQHRNYGTGQAKLAFLKAVREDDVPSFIKIEELHNLANEDTWMEFLDINVGAWEKMNLRQMSEFADCKDIYDKYYAWSSGYTHAHWASVRDTVFVTCLNPLHRFHRVPAPTRQMPSILEDGCKLINGMIDDLNRLYPDFSKRIGWHKKSDPKEE